MVSQLYTQSTQIKNVYFVPMQVLFQSMDLHLVEAHSLHLSHLFRVLVMKVTCSVAHSTRLLQCAVVKPRQEWLVKVCTAV